MKDLTGHIKKMTNEQATELAGLMRYLLAESKKKVKDIELGRDGIGWNKDTDLG